MPYSLSRRFGRRPIVGAGLGIGVYKTLSFARTRDGDMHRRVVCAPPLTQNAMERMGSFAGSIGELCINVAIDGGAGYCAGFNPPLDCGGRTAQT